MEYDDIEVATPRKVLNEGVPMGLAAVPTDGMTSVYVRMASGETFLIEWKKLS